MTILRKGEEMANSENIFKVAKKVEENLKNLYGGLFEDSSEFKINVNKKSGDLNKYPSFKFETYPYVGKNYGRKKKILFIGQEVGKVDKEGQYQTFRERRNAVWRRKSHKNKDLNPEYNPHIAGTYLLSLFFLKENMYYNKLWNKIKDRKRSFINIMKNKEIPKKNNKDPLTYIALTNIRKFVNKKKEKRSGKIKYPEGSDTKQIERKFLKKEVDLFRPKIIVFQGKSFVKKFDLIQSISKKEREIYVGHHPADRRISSPKEFIEKKSILCRGTNIPK